MRPTDQERTQMRLQWLHRIVAALIQIGRDRKDKDLRQWRPPTRRQLSLSDRYQNSGVYVGGDGDGN
jgi:hypothetical protein